MFPGITRQVGVLKVDEHGLAKRGLLVRHLLVIGIMDLRAMAGITAAITAERVAPAAERVARAIGAVAAGAGLFLIARAAALA